MSSSSSHIHQDGALVQLLLTRVASPIVSVIEAIHRACDLAEDAGPNAVLLVHIRDSVQDLVKGSMDMPLFTQWERALKRIETLRAPTVCAIDGSCLGLMLEVMLCTDYRAAGHQLEVGLAHVSDTLWPSMAIHRLVTQLGVAQARAMVLFDRPIGSSRALDLGLVHSISSDPRAAAHAFVSYLKTANVQDVPIRRQLLLEATVSLHESALGLHMVACSRALRREAAVPVAVPGVAVETP